MPLLWLSLAFVLGLLAASAWQLPWGAWAGLAALGIAAALVEARLLGNSAGYRRWRRLARLPLALLVAGFGAGALRLSLQQQPASPADLAWYNGRGTSAVSGVINRPPDPREKSQLLQVEARTLILFKEDGTAGQTVRVRGQLLAVLPLGREWRYGDRVLLTGELTALTATYSPSYAEYLNRQGITSSLSYPRASLERRGEGSALMAAIHALRMTALDVVRLLWPMPESALMAGILLGYERDLPPEVNDAFIRTGTSHIIAISGFNISILAGLFVRGFGRFMRPGKAVLLALLAISFYTVLVGAQPSVVRAAVMGAVGLFGPLLGRRQVGANSLAFVAAIMCLFNPNLPWDVSFQLSFSGTLGLVLFANPLLAWLERTLARRLPYALARKIAAPAAEYFLFTLAAQAITLPIIAYHFQRVSLSALLANPLILPIQPLVMVLGGMALVAGMVWLPLGQLLAGIVWPLPAFTIRAVEWLAPLPNGSLVTGNMSLALVVLYYALLFALAAGLLNLRGMGRWLRPAVSLVLAGLLAVGVWRAVLAAPDGRLHLTWLGLRGGPALLLRAPGGQAVLLNGSSDARALEDALARRLPQIGAGLDMLLVTTRYTSPLAALNRLVERFPPTRAALSGCVSTGTARQRLVSALVDQGAVVESLQTGQTIDLGQGARLRVLLENEDGAALLITWGDFRLLYPGGISPRHLASLDGAAIRNPSLLVLTPADLEAQPPQEWEQLRPAQVAWYRLGAAVNRPGWISLEQAGWLEVITDGSQMWVQAGQ